MKSLAETILEQSESRPEGDIVSPREFLHLASRSAVSKVFSRLVKGEQLIRICRGLYVVPVVSRFGKRPPSTTSVLNALASKSKEVIVASGATSANRLGLTTQIPVMQIYFTSGRPRILQLGKSKIELRKAPRWQMELGTSIAGEAVRALAWMGQPHARKALQKLQKRLPHHEWQVLRSAIGSLPDWMAQALVFQDRSATGPIQAKALLIGSSQLRNEPEDSQ
jgi:hypothetical protein